MTIFDLKGNSGSSAGWNYAFPDKDEYSTTLEGTVVEIDNPQVYNYMTKEPEFWPDGNAKRNLRLTIKTGNGVEKTWTFNPKSVASAALLNALDPTDTRSNVNVKEVLGKIIRISTKPGQYNVQNPRPWGIEILGQGDMSIVRGLIDRSIVQNDQPEVTPPAETMPPQVLNAMNSAAQAMNFQPVAQDPYAMYDADIPF